VKQISILLFLVCISICACSKKNHHVDFSYPAPVAFTPMFVPVDSAGPAIQIDSFPLTVGNQWTYCVRQQTYDAAGASYDSVYFTLKAISDTVVNGIRFVLTTTSGNVNSPMLTDFFSFNNTCYYTNFGRDVYQLISLAHTDPIYVTDSTAHLISFLSDTWHSNDEHLFRTWGGFVSVTTPAGIVNCKKMSINSGATKTDQYYSNKGLVQEIQTNSGLSRGPGTGPVTTTRVITLTSINF